MKSLFEVLYSKIGEVLSPEELEIGDKVSLGEGRSTWTVCAIYTRYKIVWSDYENRFAWLTDESTLIEKLTVSENKQALAKEWAEEFGYNL